MKTGSANLVTPRWKRILRFVLLLLTVLVVIVLARGYFAFRDRIPGYRVDVDTDNEAPAPIRPLQVGFSRVKITPNISNTNKPVWLAGFSQHRAATAVHDDLWALGCVIDNGAERIGFVAIDAIGFFQDDVVKVRRAFQGQAKFDFITVCSTHNHSTPDLLGLWGPNIFHTGVDSQYRQKVVDSCISALKFALRDLEPARVAFHEIPTDPAGLVADTRKPEVFDPNIRVMHFVKAATGDTIGSIVSWADHPETVWGKNTEITADFCGYLRDALAEGITTNGIKAVQGLGGTHLYINGAIGGLMSTTPSTTVTDPIDSKEYKAPTHDKARALGRQLATRVLRELAQPNTNFITQLPISIHAHSFEIPLANKGYLLAGFLGLIDRGHVEWMTLRSEAALIKMGDASIACIPGEVYPEIVNGGIEKPEGADFDVPIAEIPPIRQMMPGRVKFVFGLANDEIGYILPKTEWDQKPPYTYGQDHAPYGEVNSVGPEAGPALHTVLKDLCRK